MTAFLTNPVFFIGFMGAGKSSVARYLAQECGLACADVDEAVAMAAGCSVAEFFAKYGEDAFRDIEQEQLAKLAATPQFVSCGGGIVERAENIALMKQAGFVVFLSITFDEAWARIGADPMRPNAADLDSAHARFDARADRYAQASDVRIDAHGSLSKVASSVRTALVQANVLVGVAQ